MTNFEKIKAMTVEELAEYIFANCDNPLCECNEDMCELCECFDNDKECDEEYCIKSLVKMLNSEVGK